MNLIFGKSPLESQLAEKNPFLFERFESELQF